MDFLRIRWVCHSRQRCQCFYWSVIVAHRDDQPIIDLQPLLYLGVSIVMKVPLLPLDVVFMENPYHRQSAKYSAKNMNSLLVSRYSH